MTGTLSVVSDSQPNFVIAIDGPSGSGKTSTSREVARRLGLGYLDTGAMYRAATWLVVESDVHPRDLELVAKIVAGADFVIGTDPQAPQMLVNGTDVTDAIRSSAINDAVSAVATNREVRRLLIAQQHDLMNDAADGIVVEGRDITTVVAPDAPVRVLLHADSTARAARRTSELGEGTDQRSVHDRMTRRDRDDSHVTEFWDAAAGVTVIDSTDQTLDEVANQICALADQARPRSGATDPGGPSDT